jgi:hypothetical protein
VLDIRQADAKKDIVYSVKLADVEEALRTLKRWRSKA